MLASSQRPLALPVSLFLAGALIGCRDAPSHEEEEPHAHVQAEAAKPVVMGRWTDLLGTTQPLPNHSARVSAVVEGHVLSVLGDGKGMMLVEGQEISKGQVVVRLDDRVPRANRAKLQAMLNDLKEQEKQAKYALELAAIDVNRLMELLKTRQSSGPLPLVSRVELEKALLLHKDSQSKLQSVEEKEAVARADLKALDEQLEFYSLRAPISGRLGIVQAVPGQTLSPGAMVAEVIDLADIDVLCYAPPHAAARLALDQPGKLLLAEGDSPPPVESATGKVAFIAIQAQPETGNIAVKIRFPNPNLRLRSHAVVRVAVLTQPEKERLTIPETALMEDSDIPTALAVKDVKVEKNKEGKEEKVGEVLKLQVLLGVRDRERRLVEVLGLEDPATKKKVSPNGLLFVTARGQGLQTKDEVILEEPEEHPSEEPH